MTQIKPEVILTADKDSSILVLRREGEEKNLAHVSVMAQMPTDIASYLCGLVKADNVEDTFQVEQLKIAMRNYKEQVADLEAHNQRLIDLNLKTQGVVTKGEEAVLALVTKNTELKTILNKVYHQVGNLENNIEKDKVIKIYRYLSEQKHQFKLF